MPKTMPGFEAALLAAIPAAGLGALLMMAAGGMALTRRLFDCKPLLLAGHHGNGRRDRLSRSLLGPSRMNFSPVGSAVG